MSLAEEYLAEVRSYLGTPFHHQGRLPGVGLDCVGVPIVAAQRTGVCPEYVDRLDYPRQPTGEVERELLRYLLRVPLMAIQPADLLLFAWSRWPQHVGVFTDAQTVIHALDRVGKTVEVSLTGSLSRSLHSAYRFKEFA